MKFTIFTSFYNYVDTFDLLVESIFNQTHQNWEWIIWDDSKDEKTYHELLELQKKDIRIQVYRAPHKTTL